MKLSLQDDFWEVEAELDDKLLPPLHRIWEAFVEMENEQEDLLRLRGAVRTMIEVTFPQEEA
jgi:hypothetical protein